MPDPTPAAEQSSVVPPAPPSRAALAAVLAQAAEAEPLLADRPPAAGWCQRVDLANRWSLWVWWLAGDQLDRLWAARAPDGGMWSFGCDRWPDWNAGPEAVPLEPLDHLIPADVRERLRQRLLSCSCWPEPDPPPPPPDMAWIDEHYPLEVMAS
jgi:hypothetical protein